MYGVFTYEFTNQNQLIIHVGEYTSPMNGMGMICFFESPEILRKNLTHFDGRRFCLNGLKITS